MAAGATLAVGPNVTALIQSSTLTDGGSLTFASGDKVSLNGSTRSRSTGPCPPPTIPSPTSAAAPSWPVNSGGELAASNSTFTLAQLSLDNNSLLNSTDLSGDIFNMPISLPYNDVQYLANNATFNDIEINSGHPPQRHFEPGPDRHQLVEPPLRLPSGFTVAAGATLAVGPNVTVLIQSSTLTDGGSLTFASGDKVSLNGSTQIAVDGTMNATRRSFNQHWQLLYSLRSAPAENSTPTTAISRYPT